MTEVKHSKTENWNALSYQNSQVGLLENLYYLHDIWEQMAYYWPNIKYKDLNQRPA